MIEAVIFDMDGVISDTQMLNAQVESELLAEYDIHMTAEKITARYSGVRTRDFFDDLLSAQPKPYDVDELMQRKLDTMTALAQKSVPAIDGAVELIQMLHKQGLPLAVASASKMPYIETVLSALNVCNYFSVVVSTDMVEKGKPDPQIFLLAADKLGVEPQMCLVIEDAVSGMEAARRANMKCIGLVSNTAKTYPTPNTVTSLRQVTSDYIKKL